MTKKYKVRSPKEQKRIEETIAIMHRMAAKAQVLKDAGLLPMYRGFATDAELEARGLEVITED